MIKTGQYRYIDDLGRINIPKEVRRFVFGTSETAEKRMDFFMRKTEQLY